jgi:hypothetical protein
LLIEERGLLLSVGFAEWCPSGVFVPEMSCRLGGRLVFARIPPPTKELRLDMLARLLGLLSPVPVRVGVCGGPPKDSLLSGRTGGGCSGSTPSLIDDAPLILLPPVRFLWLRTVTDGGI